MSDKEAEIARLRAEVQRYENESAALPEDRSIAEVVQLMEQYRAERDAARAQLDDELGNLYAARAEAERLKAALEHCLRPPSEDSCAGYAVEAERLRSRLDAATALLRDARRYLSDEGGTAEPLTAENIDAFLEGRDGEG